jgi:hypothetical protein
MTDITSKIQETPITNFPWEHKIIENFLSPDAFTRVSKAAEHISQYSEDNTYIGMWLRQARNLGVDQEAINDIISVADNILDNIHNLAQPFHHFNPSRHGYYCMPKFAITGKDYRFPIHTDGANKVMVVVLYLYPEKNLGTHFYTENDMNTYTHTLEWKPNRAFMLTPHRNEETWHDWYNPNSTGRVTIKFEIEKMETLTQHLEDEDGMFDIKEDLIWLYDQFGQGHLTTNK